MLLSPFDRRTYRNALYLLLAFPLGVVYFVFLVAGLSIGGALSILLIGFPIVFVVLACCHLGAEFERRIARYLLGLSIPSPGYPFLETHGIIPRLRALVFSVETWKSMVYLASKFIIGIVSLILLTTLLSLSGAFLLTPLYYNKSDVFVGVRVSDPLTLAPSIQIPWGELLIGVDLALTITSWEVTTLPEALAMSVLGIISFVVSFNILNGLAWLIGQFTRFMLSASDRSLGTVARTYIQRR